MTQSAANIRRCRAGGLFSAAVVRRTMKQLYDDRAKFGARYCYQRVLTRAYIKRNQISRVSIVLIDRTAQTQTWIPAQQLNMLKSVRLRTPARRHSSECGLGLMAWISSLQGLQHGRSKRCCSAVDIKRTRPPAARYRISSSPITDVTRV